MRGILSKVCGLKLEKSWQWLLYLDVLLPGLLFVLAYVLPEALAVSLARLFHSYSMYVISPIPNPAALMGLFGLLLHGGALAYAARKRDWPDLLISLVITGVVTLYFSYGLNYELVRYLSF